MDSKKPVDPTKKSTVQTPTTTSVKRPPAGAKNLAAQATTTTVASAPVKKPASTTSSPSTGTAGKNQAVKPPGAPPLVVGLRSSSPAQLSRPNSSGGAATGSSPKNPNYEPPLSLKKHGFRIPIFRPRNPPNVFKSAGSTPLPRQ
ncbi:hypothetical protein Daus18300_010246 [Diaporthe australafricana]|uniref:Uncharacterized protein n=1 Tax=Diaporthe australafricana TaxID=127596 RepID=A0ABR3WAW8_9PEZI